MVQRSVKRSAVRVRWELEEYTLDTPAQEQTVSDSTQIPNPWESYDTADAAANAAGFTLTAPEAISGSTFTCMKALSFLLPFVFFRS